MSKQTEEARRRVVAGEQLRLVDVAALMIDVERWELKDVAARIGARSLAFVCRVESTDVLVYMTPEELAVVCRHLALVAVSK